MSETNELSLLNKIDTNSSGLQKRKQNRMISDALIALGGNAQKDGETEEKSYIDINEIVRMAITKHREKHEDCVLCKDCNKCFAN